MPGRSITMLPEGCLPRRVDAVGMLASIRRRIDALELDLSGMIVVTEAATGAYACTATIAAMAGAARVYALARDTSHHGSAADAAVETLSLAAKAGVADRIAVVDRLEPYMLAECDIVTNSGHLRPIDAATIDQLSAYAVIALMFEAWEFRASDLDLDACRRRGISVAAVNERHPDVGVFDFLGPLSAKLLRDAGMSLDGARIAILCDNPFAPFIAAGLRNEGATCALFTAITEVPAAAWDALLIACGPDEPELDAPLLELVAGRMPGALLAQFWGGIDRPCAERLGLPVCPAQEPRPGHMGILLNALGDEPIIRLQAGGLCAAAIVSRGEAIAPGGIAELL